MLSLFLIQGCAAQESRLPKEMPEKITVYLNLTGGMSRSYKRITIDEGVLEFEESKSGRQNPQKRSANISREELAKLYRTFVENRFDTIENDRPKSKAYDAGSESISISLDKLKSFNVIYGKNSPLSGKNLERYEAVRKAIYDLLARSQNGIQTMNETEQYIQGAWRTAGGDGIRAWFSEWTFANGSFKQTGYPPIVQEGKYRVASVADDRITLTLYDQKGTFGDEERELQILLDKEAKQLTISGMKGFSRVVDKTDD
jgi:hypothetical protein